MGSGTWIVKIINIPTNLAIPLISKFLNKQGKLITSDPLVTHLQFIGNTLSETELPINLPLKCTVTSAKDCYFGLKLWWEDFGAVCSKYLSCSSLKKNIS